MKLGNSSHRAVIIASSPPKVESRPRVISMRKKMIDQKVLPLISEMASG